MPKTSFESPIHLASEWHEVFENVYATVLPIEYIEIIHIEFSNGRLWEIDIKPQHLLNSKITASKIIETFKEYKEDIVSLNFKINISKIKNDVKISTKKIL